MEAKKDRQVDKSTHRELKSKIRCEENHLQERGVRQVSSGIRKSPSSRHKGPVRGGNAHEQYE